MIQKSNKALVLLSILLLPFAFLPVVSAVEVTGSGTVIISATVTSPSGGGGESSGGGGGGGGGGGTSTPELTTGTRITFAGYAYPLSRVTILKDAKIVGSTTSGPDAKFTSTISSGLSTGTYLFSIYSEDEDGNASSLNTFPVFITANTATNIGGIFVSPTIATNKTQVKQGDIITVFGKSTPKSEVTIFVFSNNPQSVKINADTGGAYLLNFDTSILELGDHITKARAQFSGAVTSFSKNVPFVVGNQNIEVQKEEKVCTPGSGDTNCDSRINLIDFSVMAFWYKKGTPPQSVDLNKDGVVNLVDLSILAFKWTG